MDLIWIEIGVLISWNKLARPVLETIFLVSMLVSIFRIADDVICVSLSCNWASEARGVQSGFRMDDICLSWAKKRNYVGRTCACSKSVLGGKILPVTPVLFISTIR